MIKEILLIIIGFLLLIIGADILVKGSSNIAKKFHIPEVIIGLTIVCIGTSMPELLITVNSAIKNDTDLIIGNAIGSNLCNLLLVLGIASILKPVKVDEEIKKFHLPVAIFATFIVWLFSNLDIGSGHFTIGRVEGIILLTLFVIYFSFPIFTAIKDIIKEEKKIKEPRKNISIITAVILIIIGIIMLKYGSDFVVDNCKYIATKIGISERIIGLTIVAVGTALPELVTTIVATIKKDASIAIGNLVGSCMLNLWLILGIGSIITPLEVSIEFNFNLILLLFSTTLVLIFSHYIGKNNVITKLEGTILILVFIVYIISLIVY